MESTDRSHRDPSTNAQDLEVLALEAFGQLEAAERWMSRPHPLLEGTSPRQFSARGKSEESRVRELLAALRFGGPV